MKTCTRCHLEKPVEDFYLNKKSPKAGARQAKCKACFAAYAEAYEKDPKVILQRRKRDLLRKKDPAIRAKQKEANDKYRRSHREQRNAEFRKWRAENPEKAKMAYKKWAEANTEYLRAKRRIYYLANKERLLAERSAWLKTEDGRAYLRAYRRSDKGRANLARVSAKRRKTMDSIPCTLTVDEWKTIKRTQKHKCNLCQKRMKLEIDHIQPISKGGHHTKENVQGLCRSCNARKGAKLPN